VSEIGFSQKAKLLRADELVKGACLMVVGIGTIILRIPGNNSLKGKRRVVKSIVSRLQNAFNASVAEVGANDSHQRAEIGLALVGNDRRLINSKLDKALNLVEDMQLAEIIDTDLELMNL
jgi:uncharacterized protein YlxP (DUF503 family)